MGVPGRVVREVTDEDLRQTLAISANYLEMAQRYAAGAFPPPWQERTDNHSFSTSLRGEAKP